MTQWIKNEKYFDGETMDDDKMNKMSFKELTFLPMMIIDVLGCSSQRSFSSLLIKEENKSILHFTEM